MVVRVLVFSVVLLALTGAQAGGVASAETSSAKPASTPRSLTVIQNDVHAALREEASTRRDGDNTKQVLRLVDLYREMAAHPQHEKSFVLRELGQQVRARLVTVKDHVKRRSGQIEKGQAKHPATVAAPDNRVLAQQLPGPAKPVNQAANQAAAAPAATANNGRPADYGPELVALIEATISPDTWNINGGPGAIIYYGPRQAMVVSAPDDVHGEIGGNLGQLRAAGQ